MDLRSTTLVVVEREVAGDAGAKLVHGRERAAVEVIVLDRRESLGAGVVVASSRCARRSV